MPKKNSMQIQFSSNSSNESFARVAVAAFVSQLDPTMEDLYDIKMAVSEAVTNSIIHGYENREDGQICIKCAYEDELVSIEVIDKGKGISDIEEAMTALYTTSIDEERAGLGFTVMQSMMDEVQVFSEVENGTTVKMKKSLGVE
ncbi:MAG: anti-sigma regulatory factor, serine/threonine protein kinase [Clostridia bacterium]|jgi:stage II sporulation protein AB (anti-sigma F factor)|nr:anti-sigma regulatory factor, serine/threonine protein kinase [Clostridia bacterium]